MIKNKKLKIAILLKGSIDFDGRVISQIDSLSNYFNKSQINIFYLQDTARTIKFDKNVSIIDISLFTKKLPKSKFWQFLKLIEYGIRVCIKLLKYKPEIIQIHDENSIIGAFFYRLLNKKVKIIYDDHELKNLPPKNIHQYLMLYLEKRIFSSADIVISANYSRQKIVNFVLKPKKSFVIENWNYKRIDTNPKPDTLNLIDEITEIKRNSSVILHQGMLSLSRKKDLVFKIIENLPSNWVVLFIGITLEVYNNFFKGNTKTKYGGYVFNSDLDLIWKKINSTIIFYDSQDLNNKYCAANRVYLALNLGIPIIINDDNPVLMKVISEYNNGLSVNHNNLKEKLNYFSNNYNKYLVNSSGTKGLFEHNDKLAHPILNFYFKLFK